MRLCCSRAVIRTDSGTPDVRTTRHEVADESANCVATFGLGPTWLLREVRLMGSATAVLKLYDDTEAVH